MSTANDIIDQLLGIAPGSHLDSVRRHREAARDNTQQAYDAIFNASETKDVSQLERLAVATFIAGLHRQDGLTDHYAQRLGQTEGGAGIAAVIATETERGATKGPYGKYPAGVLSVEDQGGLHFAVADDNRKFLGDRLGAAFDHAHLLVLRPRDASPEALGALLTAGWSTTGIVTLSQLIAYLAFQSRLVAGLTALADNPALAGDAPVFTQTLAAGLSA